MKKYKIGKIGNIEFGIDGRDEYLLVKDTEDDIDIRELENLFLASYYYDTDIPGGYFCNNVEVIKKTDNTAIVIVNHRYNV